MSTHANSHSQPEPEKSGLSVSVTQSVIDDLNFRRSQGIQKYGMELFTFNGRDALTDRYQELLDAACYTKQALLERDLHDASDLDPSLVARLAELSVSESLIVLRVVSAYLVVRKLLFRILGA